jgi:hypothetical protein
LALRRQSPAGVCPYGVTDQGSRNSIPSFLPSALRRTTRHSRENTRVNSSARDGGGIDLEHRPTLRDVADHAFYARCLEVERESRERRTETRHGARARQKRSETWPCTSPELVNPECARNPVAIRFGESGQLHQSFAGVARLCADGQWLLAADRILAVQATEC